MNVPPRGHASETSLCPRCGATRVRVGAEVQGELELARDPRLGLLTVVAAHVRDEGFDEAARAWCPSCGWVGFVAELVQVPT